MKLGVCGLQLVPGVRGDLVVSLVKEVRLRIGIHSTTQTEDLHPIDQ